MIDRGTDVGARLKHHGQTGLHWAAGGGHVETVAVLLRHAAPVDARDEEWNATPMEWALFGWQHRKTPGIAAERYYAVVARLVAAGTTVKSEWARPGRRPDRPRNAGRAARSVTRIRRRAWTTGVVAVVDWPGQEVTMAETLIQLDLRTRGAWRQWLAKHYASSPGIWLIRHKPHTGVTSMPYEDLRIVP